MCLSTVTRTKGTPLIRARIGYKVFGVGPVFMFFGHRGKEAVSMRCWMTAQGSTLESVMNNRLYSAGFHIYMDLSAAINTQPYSSGEVYKVEYKGRCTYGLEIDRKIVVAERMRVLGRCNGKGELI